MPDLRPERPPLAVYMAAMDVRALDLARTVGVSSGHLSLVMNGHRRATPELRAAIAAALEVPEADLFG